MILYHGITTYHMLEFITHRLKFSNKNKEAVLIIPDFVDDKYNSIIESGIFNKVIIMPYRKIMYKDSIKNNGELLEFIKHNNSLKDLSKYEEIHVAGAHYYFTEVLFDSKVPFYYHEEASGILNTPSILENIVKNINESQYNWAKKNNMFNGNNELVIKKICNTKVQAKEICDEKIEHFDIIEEYLKLTKEEQKKIKSIFTDIDEINVDENVVIFLTQHFANLDTLSFEEHILIYQLVIDYFFKNDKIVFKTHPDDIMYYSILFPQSQVIKDKFPSEFLPTMFTKKPKEIATITSTAVNNLYPYFDKSFRLDNSFEKYFKSIHKYYLTIKLLRKLNGKNIKYVGSNKRLVNNLINHSDIYFNDMNIFNLEKLEQDTNCTYIIDDIKDFEDITEKDIIKLIENLSDDSNIIFINSDEDYCFYDYESKYIWENITPICINKKILKYEEVYENNKEEVIYFYSKNKECTAMAEALTYEKELENTGVEVSIAKLTEEQRRIKVLEGILRATEKRLLHYIKLAEENN